MAEEVPRCRMPNSLKFWASEATAHYIVEYCHLPILTYGLRNSLGDRCREQKKEFTELEEAIEGTPLKQDYKELVDHIWYNSNFGDYCKKNKIKKAGLRVALDNSSPKQNFSEFVKYLKKLQYYYWESSPLGDPGNYHFRTSINRSLIMRLRELDLPTLVSFLIHLLFCHEIPEWKEGTLQFSSNDDCEHLGKLLEELAPFFIRSIDTRWFRFRSFYPVDVILQNSRYLTKMLICGTMFSSKELNLLMSLKHLREIFIDMRQAHPRHIRIDLFCFFFSNEKFHDVVARLAHGRDCQVTFPNLKRLYVSGYTFPNAQYLLYCLLLKYDKIVTNLLYHTVEDTFKGLVSHHVLEKLYIKNFVYLSKYEPSKLDLPATYSQDSFSDKIEKAIGIKFIYYNIREECTSYTKKKGGMDTEQIPYLVEDDEIVSLSRGFSYLSQVWIDDMYALKNVRFVLENRVTGLALVTMFECLNNSNILEHLEIDFEHTRIEEPWEDILSELNSLPSVKALTFNGNFTRSASKLVERIILRAPNMKILSFSQMTVKSLMNLDENDLANLEMLHIKECREVQFRKSMPASISSILSKLPSIKEVTLDNVGPLLEESFRRLDRRTSLIVTVLPSLSFFEQI